MTINRLIVIGSSLMFLVNAFSFAAAPKRSNATITSDELEIRDNGAKTFFRGHVVLTDAPYLLLADLMIRDKVTSVVNAEGNLDGTWISDKGEKIKAYGQKGRYTPAPEEITELWEKAELIRWETAHDTAPVHIVADYFIAHHKAREFYAKGHVVITQAPKFLSRSEQANYDQKIQTIHLYGSDRVFVHVEDTKGSGDFMGDEGWSTLAPKTATLTGHVQGHIIPGPTS